MHKTMIAAVVLALPLTGKQERFGDASDLRLKEEQVTIEYTPVRNEAVLIVEGETEEGLGKLAVLDPHGRSILQLRAQDGEPLALSGFNLETREVPLQELVRIYEAGRYDLRARAVDGRSLRGNATLSHDLLSEPEFIYPFDGAINVPTSQLVLRWGLDPEAAEYEVVLEQGENDGLTVTLPAGTSSFIVPDGLLAPGTETVAEVGAVHANGNRTLAEVTFQTW